MSATSQPMSTPATLHARMDAASISQKPHTLSTSPPPPGSPMPPAATLQQTLDDDDDEDEDDDEGTSGRGSFQLPPPSSSSTTATTTSAAAAKETNPSSVRRSTETSASATHSTTIAPPPEVEATLTKLTSHKNVTGVLVLSRPDALVIRAGGRDFDPSGPGAHTRSERLRRVVRMVRNVIDVAAKGVTDVHASHHVEAGSTAGGNANTGEGKDATGGGGGAGADDDELAFLRLRTKKYEMMISPSDKYLLVVLQDPTVSP